LAKPSLLVRDVESTLFLRHDPFTPGFPLHQVKGFHGDGFGGPVDGQLRKEQLNTEDL